MSNYSKLSKAELLLVIKQLDSEVAELRTQLDASSVRTQFETIKHEVQLLGKDLLRVVGYVYESGYRFGRLVREALPVKKPQMVEVEVLAPLSFDF